MIESITIDNVVRDLISALDELLCRNSVSLSDIGRIAFISGPGSFTTTRVLCSTCIAIKQSHPWILIQPITLDEAIYSLADYKNSVILLRCNTHVWHIYNKKWEIISNSDVNDLLQNELEVKSFVSLDPLEVDILTTELDWPDITKCLINASTSIGEEREIQPFYGI